jgi:hypothetical protein
MVVFPTPGTPIKMTMTGSDCFRDKFFGREDQMANRITTEASIEKVSFLETKHATTDVAHA